MDCMRFSPCQLLKKTFLKILRALSPASQKQSGVTLVETLIAISLMGIVLIPMLFLSSSYFLSQLTRMRDRMDATHSASVFLNRFLEESSLTQRILYGTNLSDANAIYYAYYEPVTQQVYRVGYKLRSVTGGKVMDRFEYNPVTQSWVGGSPYNHVRPADVILPATAEFQYCVESSCASPLTGTNVQNAVVVRLHDTAGPNGWRFTKGRQTFTLPQNMTVILSTGLPSGQVMLSDEVRQLYAIDLTASAATSPVESRLNLNPVGEMFNYVSDGSDGAIGGGGGGASGPGVLSTLLPSGVKWPGTYDTLATGPDGRVFFGTHGGNNVFTWKDNVLSTIPVASSNDVETVITSPDGRAFFAPWQSSGTRRIYSWLNGVLTTITPTDVSRIGMFAIAAAPDNRVYIGQDSNGGSISAHPMLTWHADTGLSTISSSTYKGNGEEWGLAVNSATNGIYYGGCNNSPNRLFYWDPATQVNTQLITSSNCFIEGVKTTSSGRAYFTNRSRVYTWDPSSARLSTINSSNIYGIAWAAMAVVPGSDQVFIGSRSNRLLVYTPPSTLTDLTFPNPYSWIGVYNSIKAMSDGRVIFSMKDDSSPFTGHMMTWKDGILSTITPTEIDNAADKNALEIDNGSGKVYFGQGWQDVSSPKLFWVWDSVTNVLSTILPTPVSTAGVGAWGNGSIRVAPDGRVFFGGAKTGNLWTWKNNVLSTLLGSNRNEVGRGSVAVAPDGRVFFGEVQDPGFVYTWKGADPTYSMVRYTKEGVSTYQPYNITINGSPNVQGIWQDNAGDLYLFDRTGGKLDRYTYSASNQKYNFSSSFTLGVWSSGATAMSIDQASAGVAFLDAVNKRIYTYADRQATGTPTPTQNNMSGLSTVPTTPTGMAVSGRTGDYLVLDSAIQSSGSNAYVRLFVIDDVGFTLKRVIPIKINDSAYISTSPSLMSETSFGIQYDDKRNLLYLTAPSTNKTYVMSLPDYL
ncbi:MAG: prepilin-type N-terminal cleavage/methylation domain-containing protein [Vampirovibrionales bacterium]|nr:prepilin-type N-terminal cleavage/methylation domain-containing protein [Vampirovibrionales bacterium]